MKSYSIAAITLALVLASVTIAGAAEPRDIEFTAKIDGTTQRYVTIEPDGFESGKPVNILIALHGHGSDRWQFVRDGRGECKAARDAAARHGMIFLSPDYRAKTSWMGPKAEADLVQIIGEMKSKYDVRKVIVCGGSMGGTAAMTFAALHPEIVDGVVAFNGTANLLEYDRFQDAIAESYGGSKQEIPEEYRKRSAEFHFEKLTMPISTTTGGRDDIVPPASVLRLVDSLRPKNGNVLSIHRPEGGHSTDATDSAAALDFVLERTLGTR